MYKHTGYEHCISCAFFYETGYQISNEHECLWYDEREVPEEHLTTCPECGDNLDHDEDYDEDYCPSCGLVVSGPYPYIAGRPISYPYGLRI